MAIKLGLWYRWCFNAVGLNSRYGVVLGVYIGSFFAAYCKFTSVPKVPFSASRNALFSDR